jgi:hypothetical protein
MVRCSENNVRKLKNMYKFTWFIVAKIRKSEVRKLRDRCIGWKVKTTTFCNFQCTL